MKYIRLFEEYNTIQKVVEEVIKYEVVFDIVDVSGDPVEREEFDDYDAAAEYYNTTYEYSEGRYRTYQHLKMLNKITYKVFYEYDTEYEEKDDIEDNEKEWEIIDIDYLEDEYYSINESSDDLLDEVEDWFKKEYDSRNYKYHEIYVYLDEEDDDYKTIQIRISDHTENIMNNDRYRSKDYYVSIVISDYDVTNNRFGMSNAFERRSNEYELRYNSDDDIEQIKIDISTLIEEIKEEILDNG